MLFRAQRTVTHPRAQTCQPAIDAGFQSFVNAEWKPDHFTPVQQPGQLSVQLGNGKRRVDPERGRCVNRAEPVSIPYFAFQVLGLAKKRGTSVGRDDQPRLGLGKPAQVMKVAVMAVQEVAVAVARLLRRGRHNGDSVLAELGSKHGSPLGVERWFHGRVRLIGLADG